MMKYHLRKKLSDYRAIIFDFDGTLYYQAPLQVCMAFELAVYYLVHIARVRELFMLRSYR
jgi:FMN phosphatase YigB (HAD superfamily)